MKWMGDGTKRRCNRALLTPVRQLTQAQMLAGISGGGGGRPPGGAAPPGARGAPNSGRRAAGGAPGSPSAKGSAAAVEFHPFDTDYGRHLGTLADAVRFATVLSGKCQL